MLIKDYIVKLNLEYIQYSDVKHICTRSEFIRLCKTGFFTRYYFGHNRCNAHWKLCESEKPIFIKENINLKR